ncbi:MAG: hypothetical protein JETCAE02_27120 [Anaerolineaceae bacterium]|nr:MAG: hypothetical protein JETCAE02_27120 [Anaerolineaceae bacterium]
MAILEDAIYTLISTDAGLANYIDSGEDTRAYPWADVPQNPTYPYIAYMRVSGEPVEHLRGSSGLCFAREQFSVFNRSNTTAVTRTAKLVAEALRDLFQGYSGTSANVVIGGVRCLTDADEQPISPAHGQEHGTAHVISEFEFQFYQPIPS